MGWTGKNALIRKSTISVAVGAFVSALLSNPLAAEQTNKYEVALSRLLASPADPEVSFDFAQAAINLGDQRSAIAALERVLALDPSLANIRLELGVLYLRQGATQLAERRLSEAIRSPNAPPEVKARAQSLLDESRSTNQLLRIDGSLFAGLLAESNVAAAPRSTTVQIVVAGQEVAAQLDSSATAEADAAFLGQAAARFEYDLGYQRDHRLVAQATYYGTRHFERNDVDLDVFSALIGPRIMLADQNEMSVHPFLTGSFVRQDRTSFLQSGGLGLDFQHQLNGGVRFRSSAVVIWQDFIQSSRNPVNDLRDGLSASLRPSIEWELGPSTRVTGGFEVRYVGADAGFEQFFDLGPSLTVNQILPSPFDSAGSPWFVDASFYYRYRLYDEPDPDISINEEQRDNRIDFRLTLEAPLIGQTAAVVQAGYTRNFSNFRIDDFQNIFGLVGLQYRF